MSPPNTSFASGMPCETYPYLRSGSKQHKYVGIAKQALVLQTRMLPLHVCFSFNPAPVGWDGLVFTFSLSPRRNESSLLLNCCTLLNRSSRSHSCHTYAVVMPADIYFETRFVMTHAFWTTHAAGNLSHQIPRRRVRARWQKYRIFFSGTRGILGLHG